MGYDKYEQNSDTCCKLKATTANPSKGGDAKLKGLKWQPATERSFFVVLFLGMKLDKRMDK